MSEIKITLRLKHEPSVTEKQILRDLIKNWCTEFCLEKQGLKIRIPVDVKAERLAEAVENR